MELIAMTKTKYTKNVLKKKSAFVEGNGNGNGWQQLWMDKGQTVIGTMDDNSNG